MVVLVLNVNNDRTMAMYWLLGKTASELEVSDTCAPASLPSAASTWSIAGALADSAGSAREFEPKMGCEPLEVSVSTEADATVPSASSGVTPRLVYWTCDTGTDVIAAKEVLWEGVRALMCANSRCRCPQD